MPSGDWWKAAYTDWAQRNNAPALPPYNGGSGRRLGQGGGGGGKQARALAQRETGIPNVKPVPMEEVYPEPKPLKMKKVMKKATCVYAKYAPLLDDHIPPRRLQDELVPDLSDDHAKPQRGNGPARPDMEDDHTRPVRWWPARGPLLNNADARL